MEFLHLFCRNVIQSPNRTAIETSRGAMTYQRLAVAARQVARSLKTAPTGVVTVLARDPRVLAAALIGAMASGRTFAPIDLRNPVARLKELIAECGPGVILTDEEGSALLDEPASDAVALANRWLVDLAPPPYPDAAAELAKQATGLEGDLPLTLFFTSGSTGRPKGILSSRAALDHFLAWEIAAVTQGRALRVSQLSSAGFDAVLRDLCLPLATGGTVVGRPNDARTPIGRDLAAWLKEERIELVHAVPSVWRTLTDLEPADLALPDLMAVLLSGEPLTTNDVLWWRDRLGAGCRLMNLYGPSETLMIKLCYEITTRDIDAAIVPIGRPLPGVTVRVVDGEGGGCQLGDIGDIEIETPFPLLGYLDGTASGANDAFGDGDLTLRRYRSGDMGRQRADGMFECLGRRDRQIKISGVRLELDEIETIAMQLVGVSAAAADLVQATGETSRLWLWVVAAEEDLGALRAFLRSNLPPEMTPAQIVRVATMPRTLSGKLDRRALPRAVKPVRPVAVRRSAVEARIAGLWAKIVGIEPESGEDFAEAGGDSLSAARFVDEVNQAFGVRVSLRQFLQAPTLDATALAVERALARPVEEFLP